MDDEGRRGIRGRRGLEFPTGRKGWPRHAGAALASIRHAACTYNLGSTGVAGNNIVMMGAGLKHKPRDNVELGVVYEFPLTQRRDLLESRLIVDCILRY